MLHNVDIYAGADASFNLGYFPVFPSKYSKITFKYLTKLKKNVQRKQKMCFLEFKYKMIRFRLELTTDTEINFTQAMVRMNVLEKEVRG